MPNKVRKPETADYIWLLALALIWSTAFMFIKIAVQEIPPFSMTALRLTTASMAMVVFYGVYVFFYSKQGELQRFISLFKRTWWLAALSAISGGTLPFSLIALGTTRVDSAVAAVLMGVMPLVTLLLAHITWADEKLNLAKLIGILLGFSGMMILSGYDAISGLGAQVPFQLIIALSAVSYAVNSLIMRRLSDEEKIPIGFLIITFSAVFTLPVAFLYEGWQWGALLQADWFAVFATILLGVVHTSMATMVMFRILYYCGAGFFAQINFMIPILGFSWGVIFLNEAFRLNAVAALIFIVVGITISRKGQG